jgi:hypothetical protein
VIGRTVFAAVAALVLSAGIMMTPAMGKGGPKCGQLCKTDITDAKALCTQPKKKDKRACLKAARRDTIAACNAQPKPRERCLPASPSGAFLD